MTTQTEKPILMSAPMVRAILDGRKTQTRREIKLKPPYDHPSSWPFVSKYKDGGWVWTDFRPTVKDLDILKQNGNGRNCPHGQPGDRLWVRETFLNNALEGYDPVYFYRADGDDKPEGRQWKPAIFMPRQASRITLEITQVGVERLQEISDSDAFAEGVGSTIERNVSTHFPGKFIELYRELWESINGKGSWQANPWVWVIHFKRV